MDKLCGEGIGLERRIEKKEKMMDNESPPLDDLYVRSSPRSLSFFRNREFVWLVFAFQSNQQSINDLFDVRHVLFKDCW